MWEVSPMWEVLLEICSDIRELHGEECIVGRRACGGGIVAFCASGVFICCRVFVLQECGGEHSSC